MSIEEVVRNRAIQWGMGKPDGSVSKKAMDAAYEYMACVKDDSHFAIQVMTAYELNGVSGVLLLASTPQSCILDNENTERVSKELAVVKAGWMLFKVLWYPNQVLLNFKGMADVAAGGVFQGTVEEVFDAEWNKRNKPAWRNKYGMPKAGEQYFDLLFVMLHDLGIPLYILFTSGYSLRGYRALDVYVRPFVYGQYPAEEAWYMVNAEKPWSQRQMLKSDEWYLCDTLRDSLLWAWLDKQKRAWIRMVMVWRASGGMSFVASVHDRGAQ